jgi:hypothetical protein
LKAGDVLEQRGTIHNRVNREADLAQITFVLIAAKSVTASSKVLNGQS